ncbi:unnamed protein product [Merluccius merluccius]
MSCVAFGQIESLKHLNLEDNGIEMLYANAFQKTPLVHLNLARNHHMVLEAGVLQGVQGSLQSLSLSETNLTSLDLSLPCMPALSQLNLSNNLLDAVPSSLSCCPLRVLDVSNNALVSMNRSLIRALSSQLSAMYIRGNRFNCCDASWLTALRESRVNVPDFIQAKCAASEEVQRFLDGSFSTHRYCELSNSLDAKCQTLNSLLTALQDVPQDPQSRVKASADHGDITNRLYLKPDKAVLTTDVLKFGPILQNVLLAGSITKAVQVLGATLSLRRLQHILGPHALAGDVSCDGVEPSQNTDAGTTDPSSDFQMEENKECVMFKDKAQSGFDDCSSSSSGGGSSSSRDAARCVDASPPKEDVVAQYTDGHVPVFRVKRTESSEGTQIYSCMILTKTELWDIGEVVKQETRGAAVRVATEKRQNEGESGYDKIPAGDPTETPQSPRCTNTTCGSVSAKTILLSRHTSIPKFEICAFKEMEVVVSHVVTPGNFYIQHPDVMAKQRALVKEWNGPLFAEENSVPDIGTLVMGFFSEQKQWCRAQVIKICGVSGGDEHCEGTGGGVTNISVEVMRLDHGDTACLSLRNVGYLTPDMAVLPLQAARVSLASVTPAEGSQWTEQAVSWFKAMVENRTLYARLYPLDSTITVQLFLEKGKMGAMRYFLWQAPV